MTTTHTDAQTLSTDSDNAERSLAAVAASEARRRREHSTNASNELLALLRAHHDHGAGELILKGGRRRVLTPVSA